MSSLLAALPLFLVLAQDADPAKDLKSKDAEVRLAAVRQLAGEEHPKRERLLSAALRDEDWEVVEVAAATLGELGATGSLKDLASLALEGPVRRVRRVAAESLGKIDPQGGFDLVAKKVGGKLAEHAAEAIAGLAPSLEAAGIEVSPKPLEKALKSKEGAAREAAAFALVRVAGAERATRFESFVDHGELRLQAAALEAVAECADPSCIPGLQRLLARAGLNDVLKRRIGSAWTAILRAVPGDERGAAAGPLLQAAAAPVDAAHAARTARLLGRLAERALLAPEVALGGLDTALASDQATTRRAAAGALGRIGGDDALARAEALAVEDAHPGVRLVALDAATRLRPADAEGEAGAATVALCAGRLADDPDARVREEAAVRLGVKGQAKAVAPLVGALQDSDWGVVACAAVSLGKTRRPEGLEPLADLASGGADWRRRGAAVVGLGHLYHKEAIPHVIARLDDEDAVVRRTAHEYLVSVANRRIEPEVKAWEAWWAESGPRITLADPEEEAARRERYGYERSTTEIYEGLDVVVFESRGDHIQDVLAGLGVNHRLTAQGRVSEAGLHARAVFVSNCTGEMTGEDVERVAWFLRVGGYAFGSCWAVQETIARAYPGVVRRLNTNSEVLDEVLARPCVDDSPYLEGVFGLDVEPVYALEGAYLIEVLDPERCEVLVDSPECADAWGGGNLSAWFRAGHGVVLDSVNHFEEQGLARAPWLKKPEDRMAFAVDHMGLTYAELRELRGAKFWKKSQAAAEEVQDLSVLRLVTNFVRQKRIAGDG